MEVQILLRIIIQPWWWSWWWNRAKCNLRSPTVNFWNPVLWTAHLAGLRRLTHNASRTPSLYLLCAPLAPPISLSLWYLFNPSVVYIRFTNLQPHLISHSLLTWKIELHVIIQSHINKIYFTFHSVHILLARSLAYVTYLCLNALKICLLTTIYSIQ